MKAKVVANLHLLEEYGNLAREPLSKELRRGWYIRVTCNRGNDIVRILYFFDKGKMCTCTNGFVKKRQKTPRSEIDVKVEEAIITVERRRVHMSDLQEEIN